MENDNKIQWVYEAENNQQLKERYDEWAKDYDEDLESDFGYLMPRATVEAFEKFVSKDAKVLDAGAGTGLVGNELSRLGYANLDAMDMSDGMLEVARSKGVYSELHQMTMGEPLGFDADSYDATIGVGVLTLGHAPAHSFDELVRITKPGGFIAFTLRPDIYERNGFREKQQALENDGKWELAHVSEEIKGLPKGELDVYFQIWIYKVKPN